MVFATHRDHTQCCETLVDNFAVRIAMALIIRDDFGDDFELLCNQAYTIARLMVSVRKTYL